MGEKYEKDVISYKSDFVVEPEFSQRNLSARD